MNDIAAHAGEATSRQAAVPAGPQGGDRGHHRGSQPSVDVSLLAQAVLLFGNVRMDAEAFGVTVSRRQGAATSALTPNERDRLLDVLCHAHAVRGQCKTLRHAVTFPVWVVSSDASDPKPRVTWLVLTRDERGGYVIGLSDV